MVFAVTVVDSGVVFDVVFAASEVDTGDVFDVVYAAVERVLVVSSVSVGLVFVGVPAFVSLESSLDVVDDISSLSPVTTPAVK